MYPFESNSGINVCLVAGVPKPINFDVFSSILVGFSIKARIEASLKYFGGFVYFSFASISVHNRLFQSMFSNDCSSISCSFEFIDSLIANCFQP